MTRMRFGSVRGWQNSNSEHKNMEKRKKETKKKHTLVRKSSSGTHPAGFALIFKRFLCVLCRCLDIIHCVFNMIFYTINHFTLLSGR